VGVISTFTAGGTVEKALFSITCTTCQRRLVVRSEQAIGAILECPKCGSMVQVVPPKGWVLPEKPLAAAIPAAAPAAPPPAVTAAAVPPATVTPPPAVPPVISSIRPPVPPVAPPLPNAPPLPGAPPLPAAAPAPVSAPLLGLPAGLLWHKWLLLAGAPLLGLILVMGTWMVFFSRSPPEPPEDVAEEPLAEATAADGPAPADEQPKPVPDRLDPRWLPDRTALVFSFHPSHLALEPNLGKLLDQGDETWAATCGAVLRGLELKPEQLRRVTWVSADLSAWREQSVVIIELQKGYDTEALAAVGEAAGFSLAGAECRRLRNAAWPHPLAAVDRRTIVTGEEQLLRHLAARSEVRWESAPLERLWKALPPEADALLMLDLAAARKANWKLPTNLLDVWPAGKKPWHAIWEIPEGLGLALRYSERLGGELALVCEGETAADKAQAALDELMPAAETAITSQIELIPEKLKAGLITAPVAEQYELLLKQGLAALQAAKWEIEQGIVWLRVDWSEGPGALAALAVDSRPAIRADWLSAAEDADRENYTRLLSGLVGHQKAEGRFPAGAAGGVLLPPETRLSWIATMLPYYGHADWHRRLQPNDSWNGPQNAPITRLMLPDVINPALGPAQGEGGFPVTHYVGVAGVGADAGRLKADDPRAGAFGYGRGARPEEMTRGTSNTLALLGVTKRVGPWGQGGDATVRPLTQPPYVNGPDGFGSGQPNGMLVGMADGSVHFISKNVDPRVLEQLAALRGNEDVTIAALTPKTIKPKLKPPAPKPGAEKSGEKPGGPVLDPGLLLKEPGEGPAPKPQAPHPDLAPRLVQSIPAMELKDVPLARAVHVLAGMSTVPIAFDPDALQDLEITLSDPVTVELSGTTVGKALEAIVTRRGLVYVVEGGQVLITSPPEYREKFVSKKYTVSDLADTAAATADLAALVQQLVVPESWRANGGRGTIQPDGNALAVVQTEAVHRRVLAFCEKLRTARGKPLKSRLDPDRFTLTTRQERAHELLSGPITVNFHEPTPLPEILAYLEEVTQADIFVDRVGLSAAGQSADLKTTWKVEKQPLAAALGELLQPLGLACRIIDRDTLQVSTRKAVDARLELEFYPVAEALAKGQKAAALLERIRSGVAPATWSDAGGPAVLYFDKPSGCLIVLQSQPAQAAVQKLLAEKPE